MDPVVKRTKFVLLVLCVAWFWPQAARAKNNGFPSDSCGGCHRGGSAFKPTITADRTRLEPGESVVLTLHIPTANGPAAGVYLTSNNKGKFAELPGEGLKVVSDTSLTHTEPKTGAGESTFKVRWTAPAEPGGAMFDLIAVSSNRNGGTGGDSEGTVRFNLSVGCDGIDAYLDQDGDGWGIPDLRGPTRVCALGTAYSLKAGDCNDYDKRANPEGREICNLYDDDCDGMTNEGLETETVYKDEDGDGYGSTRSEAMMGCPAGGFGMSSTRDDCDDTTKEIRPGVKEICNNRDDDCNSRVDDGARASCGEGWCRRLAPSCDPSSCQPGMPRAEMCNAFDDDCDGVADNGPNLCGTAKVCYKGTCLTKEEAADVASTEPDAGAGSDGGTAADAPASGGGGGTGGRSGSSASTSDSPSGCAVATTGGGPSLLGALGLMGLLALLFRRRSRS
jgi:MYXO-CTERM domain-containing protein